MKIMKTSTNLGIIKFPSLKTIQLATYCECRYVPSYLALVNFRQGGLHYL